MGLLRRVTTLSSWTLGSRLLGLWRDRLLGAAFGASLHLDAFMLAFALPNLLRNLFGEGALAAAFVPRYVRARDQDPPAAESFAGLVLTRLSLVLALLAGLGMVAAALLILYGAPRASLVAILALPQLPYLIFICVSALMAGVLNGRGHFWIPAAAPLLLNICLITAVLLWSDTLILPYAVLCAGLLQLFLHLYGLKRSGGIPPLSVGSQASLRDLRRAWIPTLAAASIHQVNALSDSMIAFILLAHRPGAVTVLYFANRLLQFPMALLAHGVTTAIYPDLSRAAEQGWPSLGRELRRGTTMLTTFLLPASLGLWLLADPLVRTIFQSGAFASQDASRTIVVTQIYALALIPLSLQKLFIRAMHASLDQRTPVRIALLAVSVNLILNIYLVQTALAEAGLALASLISGCLACLIAGAVLFHRGCGALISLRHSLRPLLASLFMAGAVSLLLQYYPLDPDAAGLAHALRLCTAVALGVLVFVLLAGTATLRALRS